MKINKSILGILAIAILSIGVYVGTLLVGQNQDIRKKAAPATVAYVSPSTFDNQIGTDFSFYVKMDSASNQISGVDIRLSFDKNNIQIVSLEKGSGATNLETPIASTFDNSSGKIKYIIYTGDKTKAISGSGIEILKVNAKSKSNSTVGEYIISFDSETAASGVTETQNILTSLSNGKVNLVTTPVGGYVEGEPNSCGGTCGSNYNCKANYYCYKGFCRNPICSDDSDCICSIATTAPTIKPTIKPSGQNKGGAITKSTPITSSTKPAFTNSPNTTKLESSTEPLLKTTDDLKAPENQFFAKYAIYLFGAFIIIVITSIVFAIKKNRYDRIPHILPPTNI